MRGPEVLAPGSAVATFSGAGGCQGQDHQRALISMWQYGRAAPTANAP
jgi:hypothetical protein